MSARWVENPPTEPPPGWLVAVFLGACIVGVLLCLAVG